VRGNTTPLETGQIALQLEYDTNDMATVETNVEVVWDMTHARIAFRLAEEVASVRWVAIADTVIVGLDETGSLVEIRFDDCQIDDAQATAQ
jgi:hypothetical protein